MRSAALGVRIEESNDPSELVPDHLLPVQFTELLQRPSERTPEHKLMAAVLEEAIRTFCRCAGARGASKGLVEKLPHSRRYRLTKPGYSICLVFLKLFFDAVGLKIAA